MRIEAAVQMLGEHAKHSEIMIGTQIGMDLIHLFFYAFDKPVRYLSFVHFQRIDVYAQGKVLLQLCRERAGICLYKGKKIIELWGLNVQTDVSSKKNFAQLTAK